MEVSDREKERILDEQIRAAMTLLAVLYPPGCENVIELPGAIQQKKSKYKLTLRSVIANICKLIDKRIKGESMALIQCPECKKEISDSAPSCPSCGYALNPTPVEVVVRKKGIGCFGLILIIIVGLIIAGALSNGCKDRKVSTGVSKSEKKVSVPTGCKKHIEIFDSANSGIVDVNVWENPDPNRGSVVGKIKAGSRAVIIEELKDGYIIQSPWDKSIGFINKVQVKKTLYVNTESFVVCKP